jgi:hypothetical protein
MNDIQRIYRHRPGRSPRDAIRVVHRLGAVWYVGRERLCPPVPTLASLPWVHLGVQPVSETDGVEDRLIVCDAELARHGLAWRIDAAANQDNVFVRLATALSLVDRVDGAFGPQADVRISGIVRNPLAQPQLEVREVRLDDRVLGGVVLDGVIEALGLDEA